MKENLKRFFIDNYKFEYNIKIDPDHNFDEILVYHMNLYYHDEDIRNVEYEQYTAADIYAYIFNSCELVELLNMADSISGDILYVAERFYAYSSEILSMGSTVIMDGLDLKFKELEYDDKLKLYIKLLKQFCDVSYNIGVGNVLLMSKSLQLEASELERKKLISALMKIGFVPISQDEEDFVLVKDLTLRWG